jgi:succinoglycan biosynthesis transport protein ExoP
LNERTLLQDARGYLAMLHKRRAIVITCLVVSFAVAIAYNYTTRPVYQATAQILIERDAPNILPNKDMVDVLQGGADYYQTQYQLLRGRTLAEVVVERQGLQKSAEFATGPMMNPWERFERLMGRPPKATLDNDGMPLSPAVAAFRSRVTVEPVPGSRLVNLRFTAYSPAVAAQAVNALADAYIQQSLDFRFDNSTAATGWLGDRLKEQEQRVQAAEKTLQQYREQEGLINFEERQSLVDQKLQTLNGAMLNARTERIAKETLFNQVRNLGPVQLESFPSVMANPVVSQLKNELSDLQKEQTKLAETLGDKHPEMLKVRSQIRATEEKLHAEARNVVRAAENDYRTAASQEANLNASLEAVKQEALGVNRKAIEFGVLKREVESNQQIYKDLLNRNKQTGLQSELKTTNIRVVEKAETPRAPISPLRMRNYQLALLIGLGLGIGLVLLFEHLDNTLKTPEDVKEQLGLPFLGMVPDVGARPQAHPNAPRASPLILKNPQSAVAESYRVLRTNLIFSSAETSGRALVVSSANPGEGKTTTVANLASSLAINGARVLAVDADLRRPTMHQHFGVPKTPGLSDLIVGKCQASDAIHSTRFKGLQVLPCGYIPPNPAELLGSAAMKQVVEALRTHYDWVLIDTPPILAMADTPVLCPLVDGVVLVVGAEVSGRTHLQRAIDQITSVGGKIIGVVLNKVNLERNSYYYSQYYGEYYRSYYAEGASSRQGNRGAGVDEARPRPRPVRRA